MTFVRNFCRFAVRLCVFFAQKEHSAHIAVNKQAECVFRWFVIR